MNFKNLDYKSIMLQFSMLLILASMAVFVVAGCGFSQEFGVLENIAWAKFKAYNTTIPNINADVYLGLRTMAFSYIRSDGFSGQGTTSIPAQSCSDSSNGTFALLVLIYVNLLITLCDVFGRMTKDSESLRWRAVMTGVLTSFIAIVAQASWYQQCYINNIANNRNFTDHYPYVGFTCCVSGFVMMVVYSMIHAMIPGYIPQTYIPSSEYNGGGGSTYLPTAVPGPPKQGRVIGVVPPTEPVVGKIIST